MKNRKRLLLRTASVVLLLALLVFFGYCNNTALADTRSLRFYERLKDTLAALGYNNRLLVISTRRLGWHNRWQVRHAGAAPRSRHLAGEAIDFLVFDLNRDGRADSADVGIVYRLLDHSIVGNAGGVGTYTGEAGFLNRQQVHLDCRGYRARWHR